MQKNSINNLGRNKNLEVDRKNLKHYTQTIKMILLLKLRKNSAEALSQKMPGQDKTIGEVFKEQEKWLKRRYECK